MNEKVLIFHQFLGKYFIEQGMDVGISHLLNMLINVAVVAILWYFIHYITKTILLTAFKSFTDKTKTTFDDFLVKSNFPQLYKQCAAAAFAYSDSTRHF